MAKGVKGLLFSDLAYFAPAVEQGKGSVCGKGPDFLIEGRSWRFGKNKLQPGLVYLQRSSCIRTTLPHVLASALGRQANPRLTNSDFEVCSLLPKITFHDDRETFVAAGYSTAIPKQSVASKKKSLKAQWRQAARHAWSSL